MIEKSVGINSPAFLKILQKASPAVHAVVTDPEHLSFISRIGALRHSAAHRSPITPTRVLQTPVQEPTNEELDAAIHEEGWIQLSPFLVRRNGASTI